VRPIGSQFGDRLLECRDAPVDLVDGEQVVIEGVLLAGQLECLERATSAGAATQRGSLRRDVAEPRSAGAAR
jgi:hypothetical protein